MEDNKKFVCDAESGYCGIPSNDIREKKYESLNVPTEKPLHIVYFSDPICSYCWNLEGYLRRLQLEYGDYFTIEERMGGLMASFGTASYEGEITDAEKMARLWNRGSADLRIPINGDVWLKNPLSSSFPPSIAFKAALQQGHKQGELFLRRLREELFVGAKDISSWEVIAQAAEAVKLNMAQFQADFEGGVAEKAFQEDLKLTKELAVDLFPTLFFVNSHGMHEELSAPTMYVQLESAVKKLTEGAKRVDYDRADTLGLVKRFGSLYLKELSILTEKSFSVCEEELNELVDKGKLARLDSPKGSLWRVI